MVQDLWGKNILFPLGIREKPLSFNCRNLGKIKLGCFYK